MERLPDRNTLTPAHPRASVSLPLLNVTLYRPGPYVAFGVLAVPVVAAMAGVAIALGTTGHVPLWLPLVVLLWIPCLPLLWLSMQSVRISTVGIGVGRPWQSWREVQWTMIERFDKRHGVLRIESTSGETLTFAPIFLRDGLRLYRHLLLRVPTHVMTGTLRHEAQKIITGDIYPMPDGGLSGMLRARPRGRWLGAALVLLVVAAVGGFAAVMTLPRAAGIPLALIGALVVIGIGVAVRPLLALVIISEKGIVVSSFPAGAVREMQWSEVQLIERDRFELMFRLRGAQRLVCPGPNLFRPAERNVMRAFFHEYCVSRGVPVVQRAWLL